MTITINIETINVEVNMSQGFTGTIGLPISVANGGTGSAVGSLVDCDNVAYTDFSGSVGFTGFSVAPTLAHAWYKKVGRTCFCYLSLSGGTSNTTAFTITGLPFTGASHQQTVPIASVYDNSAAVYGFGSVGNATTILSMWTGGSLTGWTASGSKYISSTFNYETA